MLVNDYVKGVVEKYGVTVRAELDAGVFWLILCSRDYVEGKTGNCYYTERGCSIVIRFRLDGKDVYTGVQNMEWPADISGWFSDAENGDVRLRGSLDEYLSRFDANNIAP